MLKIGEFSKMSLLTVKTLRYYEKEGLLTPAYIDQWTGYRFYETGQLAAAAEIKAYRQLGLSIAEIKVIFHGEDPKIILAQKARELQQQQDDIKLRLSIINHILENREDMEMKYQVTIKEIPSCIVYYSEKRLNHIADAMQFIPECGAECLRLNPDLQCAEPPYEFCEYLDDSYQNTNVLIRHSEAVTSFGKENELIKFREIPATRVLSIYHHGAYDQIGAAYAYIMKYAEDNGFRVKDHARECYIDGIWNKDSVEDWLTEIQLPIE